jgi:hypothetical protein
MTDYLSVDSADLDREWPKCAGELAQSCGGRTVEVLGQMTPLAAQHHCGVLEALQTFPNVAARLRASEVQRSLRGFFPVDG